VDSGGLLTVGGAYSGAPNIRPPENEPHPGALLSTPRPIPPLDWQAAQSSRASRPSARTVRRLALAF